MSSNIRPFRLPSEPAKGDGKAAETVDDGGDGPHDGDMRERLAKLEAILPNLATRADVEGLRADVQKGFTDSTRWTFGVIVSVVAVAVGVLLFAINRASPPTPQQPTVIVVPAAATPQAPPAK